MLRRVAHQPDPPDLAFQRAQPAGDLQVELVHQPAAHGCLVHAVRHAYGGQRWQAHFVGNVHLHPHFLQPGPEKLSISAVTGKTGFQPFLLRQPQRLAQRVVHINRRGVVIHARRAPIIGQQVQVKIPVSDLAFPPLESLQRTRADGQGCQSGRRAERLLAAAVDDVQRVAVDADRDAAQRCHGVHQQQAAVAVHDFSHAVQRLHCAG